MSVLLSHIFTLSDFWLQICLGNMGKKRLPFRQFPSRQNPLATESLSFLLIPPLSDHSLYSICTLYKVFVELRLLPSRKNTFVEQIHPREDPLCVLTTFESENAVLGAARLTPLLRVVLEQASRFGTSRTTEESK